MMIPIKINPIWSEELKADCQLYNALDSFENRMIWLNDMEERHPEFVQELRVEIKQNQIKRKSYGIRENTERPI